MIGRAFLRQDPYVVWGTGEQIRNWTYVSDIVEGTIRAAERIEDGTAIKGNLINVEPDPEKIEFGMPVEVVFDDALGRKDRDGNSYLSYFFQPAS